MLRKRGKEDELRECLRECLNCSAGWDDDLTCVQQAIKLTGGDDMAHHKLNYLDGSIKSFLRIHGYHGKKRPPSDQAKCVGQELRGRETGSRKEQQAALSEAARKCSERNTLGHGQV